MPDLDHGLSSTLDDDTTAWLTELLAVIESLDADADAYAARMRHDVELRLPGGTILNGPQALADTLRGAWATTASLVHRPRRGRCRAADQVGGRAPRWRSASPSWSADRP